MLPGVVENLIEASDPIEQQLHPNWYQGMMSLKNYLVPAYNKGLLSPQEADRLHAIVAKIEEFDSVLRRLRWAVSSAGDHAGNTGRGMRILAPGVKHGKEAGRRAQMLGIHRDGEQRVPGSDRYSLGLQGAAAFS